MAAISTALFALLKAGDEVLCSAAIYGGTLHILEDLLPSFGIARRFVSLEDLAEPRRGDRAEDQAWSGSSRRSIRRCAASTCATVAAACKQAGVLSVIDNTFASPINQPLLSMGIDLSMQSATKYLNGHSDVTGGVLSGRRRLMAPIAKMRRLLGGIMDPLPAFALGRGLKTLPLRVAQHNANAMRGAGARGPPGSSASIIPGLASHPDHAIANRQMSGFGGVVTIDVKGGKDGAFRTFDKLKVDQARGQPGRRREYLQPADADVAVRPDRRGAGEGRRLEGMMRLSIGLEDAPDLIDDFESGAAVSDRPMSELPRSRSNAIAVHRCFCEAIPTRSDGQRPLRPRQQRRATTRSSTPR